jgi:transposase
MAATLLLDPSRLTLDLIRADRSSITVLMVTTATSASCPFCGDSSTRIHSRYVRTLADLPWHGVAVSVQLTVRRFFCEAAACSRGIFAERLPRVVAPYARRTARLSEALELIGFALGGEAGARVLRRLAMRGSPDTLLRAVRAASVPQRPTPRVLGVDDFAFRRGRRHGTILIDLERHCGVDLLPDRSAESLVTWLRAHPGVEIVTRDRAGAYAEGIARGAPEAMQVADRFHLAKNLGDALHDLFNRQRASLPRVQSLAEPDTADGSPCVVGSDAASPLATSRGQKQAQREQRATRLERYQQLMGLRARGMSIQEAATQVGIGKRTAQRWISAGAFPERTIRCRSSSELDGYAEYVQQRWSEGCRNRTQIWREICDHGYAGAYPSVYHYLIRLEVGALTPIGEKSSPRATQRPLSPRHATWLLLRDKESLNAEDRALITELKRVCPDAAAAHPLGQDFLALLHERTDERFARWLDAAHQSGLPELERFATGLQRDEDAVRAALRMVYNNGQTEGQVNRLKVIKRVMYGRGNFDLLRQRVLHTA